MKKKKKINLKQSQDEYENKMKKWLDIFFFGWELTIFAKRNLKFSDYMCCDKVGPAEDRYYEYCWDQIALMSYRKMRLINLRSWNAKKLNYSCI